MPGPAEYVAKISISNTSGQFLSKVPTPAGRTFYHFDRDTLKIPSSARSKFREIKFIVTPGPGNYRLPSDFGHYESKSAKKSRRIKGRRKSMGATTPKQSL